MAFVLIIDDDSNVRYGLENLLESAGHRAVGFESAEALLGSDLLRGDPADAVDCFLLDINMPGMNGLELQQVLAEHGHRMPVIFVTAHADQATKKRAMGAGAFAFFGKPVQEEDLLQSIAAAVQAGRHA
jgi:FixJ family two-component response regulator